MNWIKGHRVVAPLALGAVVATLTGMPAHADASLNNGGFESVDAAGLPTGWAPWRPAGDGIIRITHNGVPEGSNALELVNDTADDRTSVGAVATLTSGTSRFAQVSFLERATAIAGGTSSVRVQVQDSTGTTIVPLSQVGKISGTQDWQRVTVYVPLPDTAARVKLEPMMDKSTGTLAIDDVVVRQFDNVQGATTVSVTDTGVAELNWSVNVAGVDHYTVHRGADSSMAATAENQIAAVPETPRYGDHTTAPGATYWYVVVAHAADGTELGRTLPAQALIPASVVDRQERAVLAAFPSGADVRFVYRLPATRVGSGDVTIYGSTAPITALDAPGVTNLGTAPAGAGAVTAPAAGLSHFLLVQGDLTVPATLAAAQHPRIGLNADTLSGLRAAIQAPGHHQESWKALVARVDAGVPGTGYSDNPDGHLYRAREAAFVYAVSGDQHYADLAFSELQAGRSRLFVTGANMGLDLSRTALLVAATYDWAYQGWSDTQRASGLRDLDVLAARYSTFHSPNTDLPADKASNWVGITRGMELLVNLAGYSDAGFNNTLAEKRMPLDLDEMGKHLDQAYGDSGWMQEGANYLQYTMLYLAPAVYAAKDSGISALDAAFARPHWYNLMLHTASVRAGKNMVQYGVGEEAGPVTGLLAVLMPTVPQSAQPAYTWLYDRLIGRSAPVPSYDGTSAVWNLLYYPRTRPRNPEKGPNEFQSPLFDDKEGAYHFRNGYTGVDDALLGLQNRNHDHAGWSGSESFALSFMSHDVTWARMPAKAGTNANLYSVPLVDGLPQRRDAYGSRIGGGITLASKPYDAQGGGYVSLDGHANFEVDQALREMVVDMPNSGQTVLAVHDTFGDDTSHTWNWQLRPADGTEMTFGSEGTARTFLFRKGESWLKGWVLDPDGAELVNDNGAFRINRSGTSAEFKVVMTVGRGAVPTATVGDDTVTLASRTYDLNRLASFSGSNGR